MDDEEGRAHLGEVAQRREGGARDGVCRRAFGAQNSGRHVGGELRARCNQKPSAVVKSHLKHYRRFVGGELRAQRRQSMAGNGWRMGVPPAKQPGHSMALDGNQWQSPARGARALDGNQWQSPVRGARALNGNGWQSMAMDGNHLREEPEHGLLTTRKVLDRGDKADEHLGRELRTSK